MDYNLKSIATCVATVAIMAAGTASAESVINIAGWGAHSNAVIQAAVKRVNEEGGIRLADGTMATLAYEYHDSACNAEQAIAVARRVASSDVLVGIGPTCSGAAAAMFGVFQKQVDDAGDTGLQLPILTDTAVRNGLAKISQWTFRNTPNEPAMYDNLWEWIATNQPDLKTIYGGTETDQSVMGSLGHQVIWKV